MQPPNAAFVCSRGHVGGEVVYVGAIEAQPPEAWVATSGAVAAPVRDAAVARDIKVVKPAMPRMARPHADVSAQVTARRMPQDKARVACCREPLTLVGLTVPRASGPFGPIHYAKFFFCIVYGLVPLLAIASSKSSSRCGKRFTAFAIKRATQTTSRPERASPATSAQILSLRYQTRALLFLK